MIFSILPQRGVDTFQYAVYYCLKNLGLETALHMCQALVELGAAWDDQDEIGKYVFGVLPG